MKRKGSAADLLERIQRKAPEYLDLLVAETDEDFEAAFGPLLARTIAHLEANKAHYISMQEEGLTSVLAAGLSIPGLTVTQEENTNGHVDVTIRADHCSPPRVKLGEAKIYDGPKYHVEGVEQLLNRYSTGREGTGLVLSYVRKKNIAALISKIRAAMEAERPLKQKGKTNDHPLAWSFGSVHVHSSGESLSLLHVGCNLYIE